MKTNLFQWKAERSFHFLVIYYSNKANGFRKHGHSNDPFAVLLPSLATTKGLTVPLFV